ncbi:5-oxoprolinase subunit B family protein [Methylobacterium pseudosasicola]|uniref:Sensor histidine kinase inhibitor, KipI family n=1 Tax=Methylobacterium pseudosasicola TaxID=582667 RepID=A0A1I4SQA4_9HYPH|nr:allophanate hydrolase subunit 1 [Methylobacterium pseudosasicola]SFM66708.1 sensor histidine kinase inhibitor, KipI family [Methylobacterium pseudosasicola]
MSVPRLLDAGEAALVVEFGTTVDPALSDRVLALDEALAADPPQGLRERVPTYRSLMLHYDPLVLDRARLVDHVLRLTENAAERTGAATLWTLPCCYDAPHGEDVVELAGRAGLSPEAVVALHAGATYRVYMYGFAPGFAYLGGLPEDLAVPRRASPRPPHPRNAVVVGGGLAAVATVPMPTGWYVVGATPSRLYAPERAKSFFVAAGDAIRFEPVDAATFDALAAREASGEPVARQGRAA